MSEEAGTTSHGIRWAEFAITDDLGKAILDAETGVDAKKGYVRVDGDGEGTTQANIKGLEEAGKIKWANNQSKRVSHGMPQPQVALILLDMQRKLLNKLKGYVKSGKTGYVLSSGKKPHVAMLLCSEDLDGTLLYEGFANGELIEPGRGHGTDNNNQTEADTTLTYQALTPIPNGTFADNKGVQRPYKTFAESDDGFDENLMRQEVFGLKPVSGLGV